MYSIRLRLYKILIIIGSLLIGAMNIQALEADGVIEPHRVIKMGGSGTPGILESVDVDRGDMVKKGQLLATLHSSVEKATMELAKARAEEEAQVRIEIEKSARDIARARAEMIANIEGRTVNLDFLMRKKDRHERLYEKEYVSLAEVDEAETNRRLAKAQLEEALENKRLAELDYKRSEIQVDASVINKKLAELEYIRAKEVVNRLIIRSPIDGVVVERYLSPGEYVEDQPILKLAQIDPLNVEVILPVKFYHSIRIGMTAKVIPESPIGGTYIAKVKIIDKVIDAASGTFGVRLELPNPNNRLPAGLKCKVIFPD